MFGADHYVPVLKCKRGERQALEALPAATKDKFTPLIEVDDIPEDLDTGAPKVTVDVHCSRSFDALVAGWGTERLLFVDASTMDAHQSSTGVDGVEFTFDYLDQLGLQFIPTVGLRRSQTEIDAAMQHKGRGICVRLEDEDLGSANLQAHLDSFLGDNELKRDGVDIVIDLAAVDGSAVARVASLAVNYLRSLPNIAAWRTLTLAASAFLESMGAVGRGTTTTVERTEWLAWNRLFQQRSDLARLPTFGDYGVQHPILLEGFDPRYMAVSANIRYTLDDEWLIVKGQSTKSQGGTVQYRNLASALIGRSEYMGATHCGGCGDIDCCAGGATGYGSPSVWRRIGAVHHISHTVSQIGGLTFP